VKSAQIRPGIGHVGPESQEKWAIPDDAGGADLEATGNRAASSPRPGDAGIAYFGPITPEPFAEVWNRELSRQQTFATFAAARLPSCSKYLYA
jgi:hypothetical protein